MTGFDALESVQFVTVKGKRLAVLDAQGWEALIEWLETLEDVQIAKTALAQLKAAEGNRQRAGWLQWDEVEQELEGAATRFTLHLRRFRHQGTSRKYTAIY
jgi:hypothetical protein